MEIKTDITLSRGYIVQEPIVKITNNSISNWTKLVVLLNFLEKRNIILSSDLLQYISNKPVLMEEIKSYYNDNIIFMRDTFATKITIADEEVTLDDLQKQMIHYIITYGLSLNDTTLNNIHTRDIDIEEDIEVPKNINIIELKTFKEYINDIRNTVALPIVYGNKQKNFLKEVLKDDYIINEVFTDIDLKVKINIAFIIELLGIEIIEKYKLIKTVKDVLRLVYILNDIIDDNFQHIRFYLKTSEKRIIMKMLNNMFKESYINSLSDMFKYRNRWLSIGLVIHPKSKKYNKFQYIQEAYKDLRAKNKPRTFYTIKHEYITKGDYIILYNHLKTRPGELLRSLDHIIRNMSIEEVEIIAKDIETLDLNLKLALQIRVYIKNRKHKKEERYVNIKGRIFKLPANKSLKKIPKTKRKLINKALKKNIINQLKRNPNEIIFR